MGNLSNKTNPENIENDKKFTLNIILCNPLSKEIAESLLNQEKIEQNPFNISKYELEITPKIKLKHIINKLKKNFNISVNQFEFYNKDSLLTKDDNNKFINSLFNGDDKDDKSLYLYPKNELYEISVEHDKEKDIVLKVHDSMKIRHIENMIYKKCAAKGLDELIINNNVCCSDRLALYYNLRKYRLIYLEEIIQYG